ncbi:rod-binding protein [Breznakiellaceae bacterium SP9]
MAINEVASYHVENGGFVPFSTHNAAAAMEEQEPRRTSFDALLKEKREQSSPDYKEPVAGKAVIDRKGKLFEQCQELETFLLKNLINGMRKTIQKSEFIKEGFAGQMYEDMLYDEYSKDFAKNAGFGFAELAYLELTGQRGKRI